jgi:hypothetical protein
VLSELKSPIDSPSILVIAGQAIVAIRLCETQYPPAELFGGAISLNSRGHPSRFFPKTLGFVG